MARPERFELPTNWFEASYSIQLSYGRVICEAAVFYQKGRGVCPRFIAAMEWGRREPVGSPLALRCCGTLASN